MITIKKTTAFISIFLIITICLQMTVQASLNIPDYTEHIYVNDFAGVLTEKTLNHILEVNDDLHARTGAQFVVTTVDYYDGFDIEEYTFQMFNKWGIGSEKGNGFLLLLSIGDDDYYMISGVDLDKKLSSSILSDAIDNHLEPGFASGDYDAGVLAFFNAIVKEIDRLYADAPTNNTVTSNQAPTNSNTSSNSYVEAESSGTVLSGFFSVIATLFGFIIFGIIFLVIIFLIFSSRSRGRTITTYTRPRPPSIWTTIFMGSATRRHHHNPPPPPRQSTPLGGWFSSGSSPSSKPPQPPPRSFGGGMSRGGGIGRSSAGSPGGTSRPSGGGFGGSSGGSAPRSFGGGMSRGGGMGRKK